MPIRTGARRRDLFTARAPERYKDRVPRVEVIDGVESWVMDGRVMGRFSACGVIDRQGNKSSSHEALHLWSIEQITPGAYDPEARLEVLDRFGIDAQVIFPNTLGLGGQDYGFIEDEAVRRLTIELYNDHQAEVQAQSGNRLLPLPLMPAWDVDLCVREAERVAALGARGVNMTSDPQDIGAPDLASEAWDPFWAVCAAHPTAGALPHRGQRHRHGLLRQVPVAVATRSTPSSLSAGPCCSSGTPGW